MALSKLITLENSFGEKSDYDCYITIGMIKATKDNTEVFVNYFNADKSKQLHEDTYNFKQDLSDSAANLWKQAYLHLKTLPEFVGATDV
jgi:hypothetical protein